MVVLFTIADILLFTALNFCFLMVDIVLYFQIIFLTRETQSYMLQEEYISEQLFLRPASSSHDLRLTTHSLFSSAKVFLYTKIPNLFLLNACYAVKELFICLNPS